MKNLFKVVYPLLNAVLLFSLNPSLVLADTSYNLYDSKIDRYNEYLGNTTIDFDYLSGIVPVPGYVNLGGDAGHISTPAIAGLPVYALVEVAASSLGWTANTLYATLMWITGISIGIGAFIATRSLLGGGIMIIGTLAVASSTGVIAGWIPIVMGLALVFITVLSRSM